MAEYIERQKLYNNLVLLAKYETGERQQGILGCAETVRIFPAADVEPVRHGRWVHEHISEGYAWVICSECEAVIHKILINKRLNYCPNCGARMDGGVDHA